MTKSFLLTICLMLSSQFALATSSLNCNDGQGRELDVKKNGVETVVPYYDVVFRFNGKVVDQFEVLQIEDSPSRFMAETRDLRHGKVKVIGFIHSSNKGFYQQSVDAGLNFAPPLMFDKCVIE